MTVRSAVKRGLALAGRFDRGSARGVTILTYHRVGGRTPDELDVPAQRFAAQLAHLSATEQEVVSLDHALDRLDGGDPRACVVLTFDDGFADVFEVAWPLLRERTLPFTVYLAAGLVGGSMSWEGSGAASQGAAALSWAQIEEMQDSGLCTVGNHTWDHAGPEDVDTDQLDRCSDEIERRLGARPVHFAWTWGVPVPGMSADVRARFRSAATGRVGRNLPDADRHALRRVPVRATDPPPFFAAKLTGSLGPERAYASIVQVSKRARRGVQG